MICSNSTLTMEVEQSNDQSPSIIASAMFTAWPLCFDTMMTCTFLCTGLCAALYVWFTHPGPLLKYFTRVGSYFLGLRQKYTEVGGIRLGYVERGRRQTDVPSLLMIHGFSADTTMYLPLVALLPRRHHVVLLDLPGHGESDNPHESQDVSLDGIAAVVKLFVDRVGLSEEPFHILGTSLGGAICAVYSSVHSQDIAKTTLVCPAMLTPLETEFQRQVKEGNCMLLGNSIDEVATIIDKCLYNKTALHKNKQILLAISQNRQRHRHFYERVFEAITKMIHEHEHTFVDKLRSIKAPTQLIWGEQDELIHVSGVGELERHLPNCVQVDVLKKCGHVVSCDRPWSMAKVLIKFIAYSHDKETMGKSM